MTSSIVTTIVAVIVISIVGLFVLKLLLKIADRQSQAAQARIDKLEAERKKSRDNFRLVNGYSYDWCMVFKVLDETDKVSDFRKEHSLRFVLSRLARAGLETRLFYSIQNDEVYCKIRAAKVRLEKHADKIDYKLPLDPDALRTLCERGRPPKWGPVKIEDKFKETPYDPYEYIHAKYEYDRPEVAMLYKKHDNGSQFRGVDRIKLMYLIMTARLHEGGAFLDIPRMKKEKAFLAMFPIHDRKELLVLEKDWLNFCMVPWIQPYDEIKDYFGEKIGLYFLWLGHYTTWLIPPSIAGFITWIDVAADNGNDSAPLVPWFALFVALWATFFLEYWKRKESRYAMLWGTAGFELEEQTRPQYEGEITTSAVDGSETLYFPRNEKFRRVLSSQGTIFGLILIVIAAVVSVFVLKYFMIYQWGLGEYGSIIASLANAVQIQVMNVVYRGMAIKLNDFENWRTDTEYEDNLISKTFVFQFVNSYAALIYIAFIKERAVKADKCLVSCISELNTALGTIFLTRLAVSNFEEIGVPFIMSYLKARTESKGTTEEPTECEKEYLAAEYDVMLGTFTDYAKMMIQYGYATLFVVAFPLAMVLSFINNWIQIRVTGYKLCHQYRRPEPRTAEDIGTWFVILDIVSTLSVMSNSALIVFTSTFFKDQSALTKVWLFVLFEHLVFGVKYFLALAVPDTPIEVEMQLLRQDFLVSKAIQNAEDEQDEDLTANVSVELDLTVRKTDDDPL